MGVLILNARALNIYRQIDRLLLVPRELAWKCIFGIVLVLALSSTVKATDGISETIEIFGEYRTTAQNPGTGRPYLDGRHIHVGFSAVVSGRAWMISATNLDSGEGAKVWCDGTDTYTMQPYERADNKMVTISAGCYYVGTPTERDLLGMSLPWLTYCLSPRFITQTANGAVNLPVPWANPRVSTQAYGYKWDISPLDGDFISSLSVVRNTARGGALLQRPDLIKGLHDLALSQPDYVYPDSVDAYNSAIGALRTVDTIPNGWLEARFDTTVWLRTNGLAVPWQSELQTFMYTARAARPSFPYPFTRGDLMANSISFFKSSKISFPAVSRKTDVFDFRYHKANETRIYRFARYTLRAGESWRSADDPKLLAQAERYMKRGPRYDAFLNPIKRNFLACLSIGVIFTAAVTVLWLHRRGRTLTTMR